MSFSEFDLCFDGFIHLLCANLCPHNFLCGPYWSEEHGSATHFHNGFRRIMLSLPPPRQTVAKVVLRVQNFRDIVDIMVQPFFSPKQARVPSVSSTYIAPCLVETLLWHDLCVHITWNIGGIQSCNSQHFESVDLAGSNLERRRLCHVCFCMEGDWSLELVGCSWAVLFAVVLGYGNHESSWNKSIFSADQSS